MRTNSPSAGAGRGAGGACCCGCCGCCGAPLCGTSATLLLLLLLLLLWQLAELVAARVLCWRRTSGTTATSCELLLEGELTAGAGSAGSFFICTRAAAALGTPLHEARTAVDGCRLLVGIIMELCHGAAATAFLSSGTPLSCSCLTTARCSAHGNSSALLACEPRLLGLGTAKSGTDGSPPARSRSKGAGALSGASPKWSSPSCSHALQDGAPVHRVSGRAGRPGARNARGGRFTSPSRPRGRGGPRAKR